MFNDNHHATVGRTVECVSIQEEEGVVPTTATKPLGDSLPKQFVNRDCLVTNSKLWQNESCRGRHDVLPLSFGLVA